MTSEEKKVFKSAFWTWFDALPTNEKQRFWYYQQDAAEVFFYNKHWIHDESRR